MGNGVNLLEEIKATAKGGLILADWLGAGGYPVTEKHAILRAAICVQCPQNAAGHWWDNIKSELADNIREHIAVKRSLKLETPVDGRLGTCEICHCNNPLQVWVPIEHVKKHTAKEIIEKFPSQCWKRIELTT